MSDEQISITDQQIDAYTDGLMNQAEREAFETQMRAHPELAAQVELARRVDTALRREFSIVGPSAAHLEKVLAGGGSSVSRRFVQAAMLAAAAALCGVIATWQFLGQPNAVPFFQPRPVTEIYHQTIADGFEPYYECHDDERFAATFKKRQGITLHLAAMPAGQGMLGLSYPGGLSRDTTAMLCKVDDKPVMVFVDRVENDKPGTAENADPTLRVEREVRDNLVFYEVAPKDSPSVLEYLVKEKPAEAQTQL